LQNIAVKTVQVFAKDGILAAKHNTLTMCCNLLKVNQHQFRKIQTKQTLSILSSLVLIAEHTFRSSTCFSQLSIPFSSLWLKSQHAN